MVSPPIKMFRNKTVICLKYSKYNISFMVYIFRHKLNVFKQKINWNTEKSSFLLDFYRFFDSCQVMSSPNDLKLCENVVWIMWIRVSLLHFATIQSFKSKKAKKLRKFRIFDIYSPQKDRKYPEKSQKFHFAAVIC